LSPLGARDGKHSLHSALRNFALGEVPTIHFVHWELYEPCGFDMPAVAGISEKPLSPLGASVFHWSA